MLIDEADALARLQAACARAGGVRAYARSLNVSPSFVSNMLNKHSFITGVVADDLRIVSVHAYRYTGERKSPDQERYENLRRLWKEEHPDITGEIIERAEEIQLERERQAKAREAEARLLGASGAPTEPPHTSQDQNSEK